MKYKCKLSGTVIEFTNEVDIKSMVNHPDYDVVVEEDKKAVEPPKVEVKKPSKKE